MVKVKILALSLLLISGLVACTPKESIPQAPLQQQPAAAGKLEVPSSAKAGWEEEWNRVLAQAKKEGKVVVYTTAGTEARTALVPKFQEKYGISAEFVMGKGAEIG